MKNYIIILTTLIITTASAQGQSTTDSEINRKNRVSNTGSGDVSQHTPSTGEVESNRSASPSENTNTKQSPESETNKVISGFSNTTILMIENQEDARELYQRLAHSNDTKKDKTSTKKPKPKSKTQEEESNTQILKSVELLQATTDNEKFLTLPRWQIKCTEANKFYSCEIFIKAK